MINTSCNKFGGFTTPTTNPMIRGDEVSWLVLALACFFSYEAVDSYRDFMIHVTIVVCCRQLNTLKYLKNTETKPHFKGLCYSMDPIILGK